MTAISPNNNVAELSQSKPLSPVLIMVCIYMFLYIERPWESISYLQGIPMERVYAVAMIIVAFMCNRFKVTSSPTNKWIYGFLLLHFILAPFAFKPSASIYQGIEYAKMVVLYLLMLSIADDERALKILVKAFVFSMIIYMLHSLWEYHNGRHFFRMGIHRMLGVGVTYADPNAFSASVLYCLPFVYALLRTETSKWLRLLYYGYFALSVVCVVLTGSRTAAISLLFLILLWCLIQKGKRKVFALVVAVLAICFIWSAMPEEKKERVRTLWDADAGPESAHQSAEGREIGFLVSWKMFKQVPFTGVGAGGENFIGYRMAHRVDEAGQASPTESHVLYGEVLAEFGLGGVICFIGLIVTIWRCCFYARSHLREANIGDSFSSTLGGAIIVSLLLLLLFGFGGHNFYRPLWLWIAAWAGTLFRLTNHMFPQPTQ